MGRTPLHTAAYHGNNPGALCMLRAGAKINVVDAWRYTGAFCCEMQEHTLQKVYWTRALIDGEEQFR